MMKQDESQELSPTEEEEPVPTPAPEETLPSYTEIAGIEPPEPLDDSIPTPEEYEDQQKAKTPYEVWRRDPTPDNLFAATNSLSHTVNSVLASMGASGNPDIAAKARVVTAKAIKSYNPEGGASLPTWVSNQLRQLVRDVRKSNSPISVPDGVQLDAYNIYKAEAEFEDEHGREPTAEELADAAHISVKRLEKVKKKFKKLGRDTSDDPESTANAVAGEATDFSQDALDYVYNESSTVDKKLLEYTTGYGGTDPISNKEIMAKLKLTPVQLTRRKAALAFKINRILNDLEAVQT